MILRESLNEISGMRIRYFWRKFGIFTVSTFTVRRLTIVLDRIWKYNIILGKNVCDGNDRIFNYKVPFMFDANFNFQ